MIPFTSILCIYRYAATRCIQHRTYKTVYTMVWFGPLDKPHATTVVEK